MFTTYHLGISPLLFSTDGLLSEGHVFKVLYCLGHIAGRNKYLLLNDDINNILEIGMSKSCTCKLKYGEWQPAFVYVLRY